VYRNTTIIPPLFGKSLAEELKRHHVYITASRNEPGGMHHVEGALCGLPILYINSGSLSEYCSGFGMEFTRDNLKDRLMEMRRDYDTYREALRKYPNTAERMGSDYLELITRLHEQRRVSAVPISRQFLSAWFTAYSHLFNFCWFLKKNFSRL
jgi:hypothetical protein